jgi:molecular chaperone HscA
MDELDAATHDWAGRRMNRAVQAAIEGRAVSEIAERVERAAGVEAHLDAHARGRT